MSADDPGAAERRVIETIARNGRTGLADLVDRTGIDGATAFATARRLVRLDVLVAPRPGEYDLARSTLDDLRSDGEVLVEEDGTVARGIDPALDEELLDALATEEPDARDRSPDARGEGPDLTDGADDGEG